MISEAFPGPWLLLVDDDETCCGVLGEALEKRGFAVRIAHNVPDARRLAEAEAPHYAVVGLRMPGPSGAEHGRSRAPAHCSSCRQSGPVARHCARPCRGGGLDQEGLGYRGGRSHHPPGQHRGAGAPGGAALQVSTLGDARRRHRPCPPLWPRVFRLCEANDGLAVGVQAEHIEAVRDIAAIARVQRVDAVLIGPYDLSASMGKPAQITDPEVRGAIDTVRRACLEAGVRLGIFGLSAAAVRPYLVYRFTKPLTS